MFRPMRRSKQQLTDEECITILEQEPRGVLSLLGEDGYPYGIPLDHWYCPEDGHLYFHGAQEGHKLDALRAYNKVSYCVYDKGYLEPGDWALHIKSVVLFGTIKVVDDPEKVQTICANLALKFTDDQEYIAKELRKHTPKVCCLELTPEHMTGKAVKES